MDARNEDGTFKPGHPGFKPKGSVNEFQKVTREKLGEFLKSKLDDLDLIYDELPPKEKARLLMSCAEFFLPKQKEMILDMAEASNVHIDYTKLQPETLKDLLNATTI